MKISDIFSKTYQLYVRYFIPNRNLSPIEKFRIWNANRRPFPPAKKPIDMETLYQIVGHVNENYILMHESNYDNHPVDTQKPKSPLQADINLFDWDSYIERIKKEICEHKMEKHIIIEEKLDEVLISERDTYYRTKYKITIKNLIIDVNEPRRQMLFYPFLPSDSTLDKTNKDGVYLIFENNHFIGKDYFVSVDFYPKESAYLILKNNIFISVKLFLAVEDVFKLELKGNIFTDSGAEIIRLPDFSEDVPPNVICLDDNIFYTKSGRSSTLNTISDCYFKGKNTVDSLVMPNLLPLYWSGYQNIDPQGNHAYIHKQMFIGFIEKAAKNNDKMLEARLRRELMKCERALIRKENIWHSLQDRFILGWSSFVSDYGISWLRPVLLLFIINASLAGAIFCFFEHKFSWTAWSILFAEFFNPLSHLSETTKIKGDGWISFINIAQKAILALFLYEMIKIFRRFSK